MNKIIVAIDGFSSSGKSTMAKALAKYAGYVYIDTGAMYRAVALYALQHGLITEESINEPTLKEELHNIHITFFPMPDGTQHTALNGIDVEKEIRSLEVANCASRVSAIGFVRQHLVALQQAMGANKGIVMDGRDIATVVFPSAELKVFVTASAEERARRRHLEIEAKGGDETYESVLENIRERDYRDTHRQESPLYQAPDAILMDNTLYSIDEQMKVLIDMFQKAIK